MEEFILHPAPGTTSKLGPDEQPEGAGEEGNGGEGSSEGRAAQSLPASGGGPDAPDSATATGAAVGSSAGQAGQLRNRGASDEAAKTPAQAGLSGAQPSQEGGWIRAFLRMVFVDLIGGFFSRLWGSRRET